MITGIDGKHETYLAIFWALDPLRTGLPMPSPGFFLLVHGDHSSYLEWSGWAGQLS